MSHVNWLRPSPPWRLADIQPRICWRLRRGSRGCQSYLLRGPAEVRAFRPRHGEIVDVLAPVVQVLQRHDIILRRRFLFHRGDGVGADGPDR